DDDPRDRGRADRHQRDEDPDGRDRTDVTGPSPARDLRWADVADAGNVGGVSGKRTGRAGRGKGREGHGLLLVVRGMVAGDRATQVSPKTSDRLRADQVPRFRPGPRRTRPGGPRRG